LFIQGKRQSFIVYTFLGILWTSGVRKFY